MRLFSSCVVLAVLAVATADFVPNEQESSAEHARERWDEDLDGSISEEELGDLLSGLAGTASKAAEYCATPRAVMDAAGLAPGQNASTDEEINLVLANAYPCADSMTSRAVEIVNVTQGGVQYNCSVHDGEEEDHHDDEHDHAHRRLAGDHDHDHDHDKEGEKEIVFKIGNVEYHCVPIKAEAQAAAVQPSITATTWGQAIGAAALVSLVSLVGIIIIAITGGELSLAVVNDFIAFAFGVLISAVFIHIIPESIGGEGYGEMTWQLSTFLLLGIMCAAGLEMGLSAIHGHHLVTSASPIKSTSSEDQVADSIPGAPDLGLCANIVIGDGIHNFTDGILIGIAFTFCSGTGWVVTAAVLAHELPQELVEFLVLIRAGLSYQKALLVNFLSALSCILGVVVVLSLEGVVGETAKGYLLALSAGFLAYVALGQLAPTIAQDGTGRRKLVRFFISIMGVAVIGLLQLIHVHCDEDGEIHAH